MDKQIIKLNPGLIDLVETGQKTATTRLGLKAKYHLGPVKFVNAKVPEDIVDGGYEIYKIEAISFCEITQELAEIENYKSIEEFQKALIDIYGPIEEYATLTVIYWDR